MTKWLKQVGFNALGIDYKGNKDKPATGVLLLDLSQSLSQAELERQTFASDVVLLWFAPPCGTASRSREIRRPVGPDPLPLRSDAGPDGIRTLDEKDAQRVKEANKLYKGGPN